MIPENEKVAILKNTRDVHAKVSVKCGSSDKILYEIQISKLTCDFEKLF